MQARTKAAISFSVSGFNTTNGYSTRQSVASVTCDTRAKPSNCTLSLRVILLNLLKAFFRKSYVWRKSSANLAMAFCAACTIFCTLGLALPPALRSSMAAIRCLSASIKALRRLGFSSKSSCKYGLRVTTHKSPKTSNSMRALRPVLR